MISIDEDKRIKKNNGGVLFPIDSGGRPAMMLSGFDINEEQRLVGVTSDGKLKVDASVTVGAVTIGDVTVKAKDALGVSQFLNSVQNPIGTTYALYVQDQRMNFDATELRVLGYGNTGTANVPLSADSAGKLNINIASIPAVSVNSNDVIFATSSYTTTDIMTDAKIFDVKKFLSKTFVIKNVGANSAIVDILASVDDGLNWDVYLINNIEILAANQLVIDSDKAYTTIKVMAKSTYVNQPTTIHARGYAMGA